ncbi:alkane 1-monooxygenase [Legionella sp. W05-934-2]|jgi:alkane 1-monooxygenase|uniref:alkane 1-monooxygenase n=1 Tax=Legionella sp. W05-934-2 TaxID=1198649 RepID=UPI0034630179
MLNRKKYCFLFIYLLLPLPFISLYLGGIYVLLPFFVIYVGIPLLDYFVIDANNPTLEQEKILLNDKFFRRIVLLYAPMQISIIALGCYAVTYQTLTLLEWWGFTLSIGLLTGGVGITLSHELIHKKNNVDQALSKLLLCFVCYGHWSIEHVRGHHFNVATKQDPASAPLGMNVYRFLLKTLLGTVRSSWNIEQKRLQRKGYSLFSWHNNFWWIIFGPIAIIVAVTAIFGASALAFFVVQSITAILLLEIVNYIEHYGLERRKLANGRYEPVSPIHSWNANHWFSNLVLFHLQRHSDHHTYGAKPYQVLRHLDESPQLPSGYLGMMLLAVIPPLWFWVMDKRVLTYRNELSRKNSLEEVGSAVSV